MVAADPYNATLLLLLATLHQLLFSSLFNANSMQPTSKLVPVDFFHLGIATQVFQLYGRRFSIHCCLALAMDDLRDTGLETALALHRRGHDSFELCSCFTTCFIAFCFFCTFEDQDLCKRQRIYGKSELYATKYLHMREGEVLRFMFAIEINLKEKRNKFCLLSNPLQNGGFSEHERDI